MLVNAAKLSARGGGAGGERGRGDEGRRGRCLRSILS